MHTGGFQTAPSTFSPWVSATICSLGEKFSYLLPKNKSECDGTSMAKMVSAVQWPMLISLLFWVVPGLLPISERELKLLPCNIKAPVLL